jgi:protease I
MARALLVVPDWGLSVNLYWRTRRLLEQQGFQVKVAAPRREQIEQLAFILMPDLDLAQAKGGDYDLVVFVAGHGNRDLWNHPEAHRVGREAVAAGKVVGASGAAVPILANAGLLRGRRATGPLSVAGVLKQAGADYTADQVTVDAGIVTLRRSEAFESFGQQLLEQVRLREEARKAA